MNHVTDLHERTVRWRARAARHPRLTLAALIATLIGIALLLAGWRLTRPGARFGPQDGTWLRSQINKDLYVGVDPNYPPFAEWTPEGIIGLEVDIAREVGRRLGVEAQILIMGYDGLYDSLYTGNVDMLIAGLRVDSGQEHWVYFTQPYFDAGQVLVSRVSEPVDSMRQLDGGIVAVELASAGDLAARRWQRRLHALEMRRFLLPDEAMQAVEAGEVDAALVDTVSARFFLKTHPYLMMAEYTTVPDEYVIAMRDENFRLTKEVEQALAEMREDGTLEAIIARWL